MSALDLPTDLASMLPSPTAQIPRILSIAGTDPTGGAGLHADLKSIAAMGGYGMGVVTALVAQNTQGVQSVHTPPLSFLEEQLGAVSSDVVIDAVKIGMLGSADVVRVVKTWIEKTKPPVVVLDPVMIASSGDRLLDSDAEEAVRDLVRSADLVTPNLPELAVLVNQPVATSWAAAKDQAVSLSDAAGVVVLLKGGHLDGAEAPDAVVMGSVIMEVPGERIATKNTHGTGCSLSSAMATLAGWGLSWPAALDKVKPWLTSAIAAADELHVGHGHGPIDHGILTRDAVRPGSWAREQWEATAEVRRKSYDCDFVTQLAAGTLEQSRFAWYLEQDLLYLNDYSRALAAAAIKAPTREAQAFWARSSLECLEVEAQLHLSVVSGDSPAPAPTTRAYTDHLLGVSIRGSYAELVAAILPCFWLYQDIGERLAGARRENHPYDNWLGTYGTPEFRQSTWQAIQLADAAAEGTTTAERARMQDAFVRSMQLEHEFFEAPLTSENR
jgi:hydroxymethylpyrimidine/phosphomethylpyrimidine kinase